MSDSEGIDRVFDKFESAWKSGTEPDIIGYLKKANVDDLKALLTEFLPLDIEFRQVSGQKVQALDYGRIDQELLNTNNNRFSLLPGRRRLWP